MPYVITRNKAKHFKRRIPAKYQPYYPEQVEFVQISLETDSDRIAAQRATALNEQIEQYWDQSRFKDNPTELFNLKKLRALAQAHGFTYKTSQHIAESELSEIVSRSLTLKNQESRNEVNTSALLGSEEKQSLPLTKALEDYFEFQIPNLKNKSDDQIRKWKNPRIKAVQNFVRENSDLSVEDITRDHISVLRQWWESRTLGKGGLNPATANKDFMHLRTLLSFVDDHYRYNLDVQKLFTRMRFSEEHEESHRPPFETAYIQNTLLNVSNLKGLDSECRWFLYAMADTGARPSELLGLNPLKGHIRLDTDIPYIDIQPEKDRALKTKHSKRKIPLVGTSLFAFQNIPEGFKHYYRKPDALSANLNKFLREHDLLPTSEHCVYSLRHSFEDRLTEVKTLEKVQAALMGHKYNRERYGNGPSLELKKEVLEKIAFNII